MKIQKLWVIAAAVFTACAMSDPKTPETIDGAWEVVSWKRFRNDSLIYEFPGKIKGSEMKIWSGEKFIFSGHYQMDTLRMDNYGGGTYTLENDHYTEKIQYFVDKEVVGSQVRILLKVDGDTITQTWPADSTWQINKHRYNIQKLVRIK